ncbi:MAG: HEAT repeat domain-containing protein [Anaerolineales bacterium]
MFENIQNPMISVYPAGIAGVVVGANRAVAPSGIEPIVSVGLGTYTPTPPSSPTIGSGTLRGIGTELIDVMKRLYWQASDEVFEDGVESQFSRSLLDLLAKYGAIAVSALAKLVTDARANEEISAEALRWIGLMDDGSTKKHRLWLLERSLSSPSARIRDGATLGISFMDDPGAAAGLREAIESEQIGELREDMKTALEELGPA